MEIDIPEVVAEVEAAFDRYERACPPHPPMARNTDHAGCNAETCIMVFAVMTSKGAR
jgi:hypothetical protein